MARHVVVTLCRLVGKPMPHHTILPSTKSCVGFSQEPAFAAFHRNVWVGTGHYKGIQVTGNLYRGYSKRDHLGGNRPPRRPGASRHVNHADMDAQTVRELQTGQK